MKPLNKIKVIQDIIKRIKAKIYLEIGVEKGLCFLKIKARKKFGVDPKFLIGIKDKISKYITNPWNFFNQYYQMPSDDFFKLKSNIFEQDGIDIALVDGLHTYEQSLKDVDNVLTYLNDNGFVIMHDCNPKTESVAYPANSIEHAYTLNLPGWTGAWSGDVWKTIVYLRSTRSDLSIFVLDCDDGVGIITKGKLEKMLNYSKEEIENLSYNDLEKNRSNLLNLKCPEYFEEFKKTLAQK